MVIHSTEADSETVALDKIAEIAASAAIGSIDIYAWRDLDHPEAGGSELHAARVAKRWAAAGIDVRIIASRADGAPLAAVRDGYRIERPAGRYGIFTEARSAPPGGRADATVEIWNGMPFFSPLWASKPRMVFLHHVHDGMWDLVLPTPLAKLGRLIERRLAPPFYKRMPIVTLSESSRQGILDMLRFRDDQVHVVEPGVDERFVPGTDKSPVPLVVAAGRLVTYKRFDLLISTLVGLKERHPTLQAVIAGEGSERPTLEALIAERSASKWLFLPGHIDDEALISLYQQAWVVASPSAYEGWGLTITEAAACATPAVASPIAGHRDAVEPEVTGILAEPGPDMEIALDRILVDRCLRSRMEKAALRRARLLTWDRTALETMRVLAEIPERR